MAKKPRLAAVPPPLHELRPVIVTTRTGQSIKGALLDNSADGLVLRAASVAVESAQTHQVTWHPLDGDVVVPSLNIDFYQDGLDAAILDGLVDAVARRASS